ncbi:condensation domain-containing protein [Streptomyces sp. H27-D2]|uniref:condensation domain-containing protein n=1 Tax=Streptomyces sp. H27-D2 TaxID=3046304 RepID=UPI002DBDDCB9|nr:condensation domain-containing protein [Streptomyces sp. H27-D2]MEC4019669.1 condensation domain-containing protein [Streptomyces sp. H27-D2]
MFPVSFAQRRLWFLNRMVETGAAYNSPMAFRLRGPLDRTALAAALDDVAGRHELLRTVFPESDGEPVQRVLDRCPRLETVRTTEERLAGALAEAAGHAFDLTVELPVRAELFSISSEEHVLSLVIHHIATDGWSTEPLLRDLATAYETRHTGRSPQWEPLPVRYIDYTLWQRELLGTEDDPGSLLSQQLGFWQEELAGIPAELALPFDRPRPAVASPGFRMRRFAARISGVSERFGGMFVTRSITSSTEGATLSPSSDARAKSRASYAGGSVPVELDGALHARLMELARESGCTLFMALQAGLAVLLSHFGAGTDIPVGTPVAGRADEALDDLVGFFVNTLVLRTDLSGDPNFAQLLSRVRETDLAAYEHQDVPFERVVEELNPLRSPARHPLFQVMYTLERGTGPALELTGRDSRTTEVDFPVTEFDLAFRFTECQDGLRAVIKYSTGLFDRTTVDALAARLRRVLEEAADSPRRPLSRLDVLTPAERVQLLGGPLTDAAPPATLRHDAVQTAFEAQVERTPEAVALRAGRLNEAPRARPALRRSSV